MKKAPAAIVYSWVGAVSESCRDFYFLKICDIIGWRIINKRAGLDRRRMDLDGALPEWISWRKYIDDTSKIQRYGVCATPFLSDIYKVNTMELFSRGIGRTALFYGVNGGTCSHSPLQIWPRKSLAIAGNPMKDTAKITRWYVLNLRYSTKSLSSELIIHQLKDRNETDFNCGG